MTAMLAASAVLGLSGFVASRRLREGYVQALENNLMNRTVVMEHLSQVSGVGVDVTRTLANVTIGPSSSLAANESIAQQTLALRASDPDSVRDALSMPLDFAVAPYVIRLLAWDLVAPDALRALRRMGPRLTEQLVSVLLNPEEEFAVRRRVPRVLGELGTQSAVNGLIEGLAADRFEVRFRCAQALAKIKMRNSKVIIDADNITKAVERELAGNSVPEPVGMITMDHVFRLLALVYPCKPLYAAHRGLESQDLHFRRTSLEYLENVLPAPVWQRIVPAFEEGVSLAVAG
jgi:hypothetical protein